ncbi:16S rRNA (cytosine(967)-C(5))-methyltransferase RsmB [Stenotrophomonas sp. MYb238]|uniref:16S rRNA (cytosine(967)-C(5))-methyltransferase RsmB n=1 Tax=Stenotrophomonas sp. MYb238 TaxID=2040281 RepID=UPI0012916991|nr:16S rRNA (cytosine(967)-C(5))-methyltransferase RsmB [Stenotrophomonas sp. MYb238]MQP75916.1 16S rRNA (cytosine(967)-C(5))-methyltransferase RsmB [Stenotrophomonas sp. MYb238]
MAVSASGPWKGGAKQQPGVQTRVLAAKVLAAVIGRGRSLKAELAATLPRLDDSRDRALLEAISFATLRRRSVYEQALRQWLQKPLGPRDGELKGLLLAGFAQLDALELPAHAALSATVEAARALGRERQAGLVNAVLRRAQREGFPAARAEDAWPDWLLEQVRRDWPAQAEAVFAASLQPAPLWLRVNRQRHARDAYLQRLREAGIEGEASALAADAIRLPVAVPVASLPDFGEGGVSVQDLSAQQVADALAPAPGARVLDACAAPGGKSAHLLERDPALRLLALDVDARRLQRIRETFARTGVGAAAQVRAVDAADLGAWWDGEPFDAVLLDAPCSATGVVRRQPDVLLHRRPGDIDALAAQQARLLDALWRVVAPGGVLLYATCSILRRENQQQIAAFLARTPDARIDALPEAFGHGDAGTRQRLPGQQGGDGFFQARLVKAAADA